jgi:hypothetical protein
MRWSSFLPNRGGDHRDREQVQAIYGLSVVVWTTPARTHGRWPRRRAMVMRLVNPLAPGVRRKPAYAMLKYGFKHIVTMDADGSHPVGTSPAAGPRQSGQADVAIGSCVGRGSPLPSLPVHVPQSAGSRWRLTSAFGATNQGNRLLSGASHAQHYQDIGCCFFAGGGAAIQEVEITMCERFPVIRDFQYLGPVGKYCC